VSDAGESSLLSRSWRIRLRATLWLGLVLWIVGGPLATQVFGFNVPGVRRWLMFIGYGKDICDVRYTVPGQEEPFDRLRTLGFDNDWDVPRKDKMLADAKAVERQGREICRTLNLDVLHVQARCGIHRGWRPIGKPAWPADKNLCKH
jgi:hypothetical protein